MFLDSKTKENESNNQDAQNVEVPSSWASKLELTKEQFETQYPGCQKTILYKNSKMVRSA